MVTTLGLFLRSCQGVRGYTLSAFAKDAFARLRRQFDSTANQSSTKYEGSMRKAFAVLLLSTAATYAQSPAAPSIDDVINLKRVGVAGDLTRRPPGGVHHPRDQLGRERLRNRDLDRRRRNRPVAAGHQRAQVEHATGVVARRRVARLRLGPRRQAPAVSHCAPRRRGRASDQHRGRRECVRVVALRQTAGVHDAGSRLRSDEGTREAVGRRQARRSGSTLHAPASARPRPG